MVPSRTSSSGFRCPDLTRYTIAVVKATAVTKLLTTSMPM